MYYGIHATSKSRAKLIRSDGFLPGSGRVGTGVYFWRNSHYAMELARAWYVFRQETFSKDSEPGLSILSCQLDAKEEEVLDLESVEMKDFIAETIARIGGIPAKPAEDEICGLFDLIISDFASHHTYSVVMLIARVSAPPKSDYPTAVMGAPISYIVLVSDRIKIEEEIV